MWKFRFLFNKFYLWLLAISMIRRIPEELELNLNCPLNQLVLTNQSSLPTWLRVCSIKYVFNPKLKTPTLAWFASAVPLLDPTSVLCDYLVWRCPISLSWGTNRTVPWWEHRSTWHKRHRNTVTECQWWWVQHTEWGAHDNNSKWYGSFDTT